MTVFFRLDITLVYTVNTVRTRYAEKETSETDRRELDQQEENATRKEKKDRVFQLHKGIVGNHFSIS